MSIRPSEIFGVGIVCAVFTVIFSAVSYSVWKSNYMKAAESELKPAETSVIHETKQGFVITKAPELLWDGFYAVQIGDTSDSPKTSAITKDAYLKVGDAVEVVVIETHQDLSRLTTSYLVRAKK